MKALLEAFRLRRELAKSGLLFHQFEGPGTRMVFLGWLIDTLAMTVSLTDLRRAFLISYLEQLRSLSKT